MRLSPDTQATLLLAGLPGQAVEPLTPKEYRQLALHLHRAQSRPSDLIKSGAEELLTSCSKLVHPDRLRRLLDRGYRLSDAVEGWSSRNLWVVSRADPTYPKLLVQRMGEAAPPLLYGCGDARLLSQAGIGVVGSRRASPDVLAYTQNLARLIVGARLAVISGGAKGVDQAGMFGALESQGSTLGVLADSLEKAAVAREYRASIMEGRALLLSLQDPASRFSVAAAMQRNRIIYALSQLTVVVESDLNRGGTWAGASEQLTRLRYCPVYVRATSPPSPGLEALQQLGALPWPEPNEVDSLAALATPQLDPKPCQALYQAARQQIRRTLVRPMSAEELANQLQITPNQARAWLDRMAVEDEVQRSDAEPRVYRAK